MARGNLGLAILGLAILAAASSRRAGGSGVATWAHSIPSSYARANLRKMLARWDDARIMAAVQRWGSRFLPDVPSAALLASGVTSMGAGEYGGPPDYATGLFGIEWPRVEAWHGDAQTLRELGRAVPTDRPGFTADIDGQVYLGFRGYAAHLAAVNQSLPEPLRGSSGEWAWRLAVSSYSSGPGTVARLVRAAPELAGREPWERWRELGARIMEAHRAGASTFGGVPIRGRWKAAATVVRNEQRHATGTLLAANRAPEQAPWFVPGALPEALAADLSEVGYG